ncbi:hypothetical protein SEA_SOUL22_62 [Mycobacterium phage Soul22]|uniref:DUF732 domain-containing protein n=2 Tax=Gracegardnervirinae TaxID=2946632 RepID=A0A385DPG6_9CAUD|nr:hypothetical protein I5H32_gp057 [Mycobacterium phage EleanorGeorge]YP_009963877.1 hypothetical protein I5I03_gp062 [Mycobacterium phage Soul22]AXQ60757.1 hypothetical protein SEA_ELEANORGEORGE_57 [Mycobacterium phage EleanorGeorge]QLF84281.1 hypothetical protein SEA_SOUL22_62 [Mycobacterium phage Soul22]
MHQQHWRYWWTMPLLIAAGIIGPGLAAPHAEADSLNDRFIAVIESEGITGVDSERDAIVTARKVCALLNVGVPEGAIAQQIYINSDLSPYQVAFFVAAAESVYCPQHLTNQGVV